MQEILERIQRLTERDLKRKSIHALYGSALSELGELSEELQIYHAIFGKTYKKADEGPGGEAVDLFICACCMYFANGGFAGDLVLHLEAYNPWFLNDPDHKDDTPEEFDFWLLNYISRLVVDTNNTGAVGGVDASALLAGVTRTLANRYGVDVVEYSRKKLDKWEASQEQSIANARLFGLRFTS